MAAPAGEVWEEAADSLRAGERVGVPAEGLRLREERALRASGLAPPMAFARELESGGRAEEDHILSKTRNVSGS